MDSLLVISNEPALSETLASELAGIIVEQARFSDVLARLGEHRHDLIIIDEGGDASEFDTGKGTVIRLTRPVRLSELLYTIRERLQGKSAANEETLTLTPQLKLFPSERLIRSSDGPLAIDLTEKETELLQCLIKANGKAISREQFLKTVWGYSEDTATHTLETHIYRLRGKLRQTGEPLDVVFSEEGGYLLK
jgi:DNA-binding response OmpR family regulator